MLSNIHPGEVLLNEFLQPMSISQNALARAIDIPPRRINEIVHGKHAITADTAVRLSIHFGTSEKFWLGLQDDHDLEEARQHIRKGWAAVDVIYYVLLYFFKMFRAPCSILSTLYKYPLGRLD